MKIIYPKKIIYSLGETENIDSLLDEKTLQIGLSERDTARIQGKSCFILDFGKEISGSVRILTYNADFDKRVRLRFGESVGETCAEIGEKNATNDHSLRDFCVELQSYSDMTFGNTGFRFLRVDTLGDTARILIKSIVAVSDADEREEKGTFECDDETVNAIWNTAAYTLRLCLHNGYFWDGVKRDRLVWIGDLYPEMRAAYCLYGNISETENSLTFAREQTPLPEWMNGIPMYSMWWLYILCDYYKLTKNEEFVAKQIDYILGLIDLFDKHVDENGNTAFGFNFIDWATHWAKGESLDKKSDEEAGVLFLLKIVVEKTSWLLQNFGIENEKCLRLLKKLEKKKYEVNRYKQIAALGVFAGEKDENTRNVLLKNGASGFSTFMSYFILTAISNYGEYDSALSLMKEYYGGMLKLGATTFWEDFDIDWAENATRIDQMPCVGKKDVHGDCGRYCYRGYRHSFCHGWSAGVIAYLSETVAGIRDEGDGVIRITPRLSGLKYVKMSYPVGDDVLVLDIRALENGKTEVKAIHIPKNLKVKIDEK